MNILYRQKPRNRKGLNSKESELSFYKLLWVFILGGISGVVIEYFWGFLTMGYFESQKGVIYTPFNPVYAFGALFFALFLYKLRYSNGFIIFSVSAVLGGFIEYICSWIQEKFLGVLSWDYSDQPINIYGRTSIRYAIIWGVLGYVFIRFFYPVLGYIVEMIPKNIRFILTGFIIIILFLDMGISYLAVKRQVNRHKGLESTNAFEKFLDETYDDEFLKKIYPDMEEIEKINM